MRSGKCVLPVEKAAMKSQATTQRGVTLSATTVTEDLFDFKLKTLLLLPNYFSNPTFSDISTHGGKGHSLKKLRASGFCCHCEGQRHSSRTSPASVHLPLGPSSQVRLASMSSLRRRIPGQSMVGNEDILEGHLSGLALDSTAEGTEQVR